MWQALAAAVLTAVLPVLLQMLSGGVEHINWPVAVSAVATAAAIAIANFLQNLLRPAVQKINDLAQRTWRTMFAGAAGAAVITVIPLFIDAISGGVERVNWEASAAAWITAGCTTAIAYLQNDLRPVTPE